MSLKFGDMPPVQESGAEFRGLDGVLAAVRDQGAANEDRRRKPEEQAKFADACPQYRCRCRSDGGIPSIAATRMAGRAGGARALRSAAAALADDGAR